MRKAIILIHNQEAAELIEHGKGHYELTYLSPDGEIEISLTLPRKKSPFHFNEFPPFFEGLLPEGAQLQALLRQNKIDERDYFSQLIAVGGDLVGAITIREAHKNEK